MTTYISAFSAPGHPDRDLLGGKNADLARQLERHLAVVEEEADPRFGDPEDPLLLAVHGVTALPVVDGHDRVVGIISEADLIGHQVAAPDGRRAKSIPVVVDAADQVVGIVSRSDLMRALGWADDDLEHVSAPPGLSAVHAG